MSKQDILTVTTLAAHLAKRSKRVQTENGGETLQSVWDHKAETCAADAMALQRLGRRARRNAAKRWIHPENRDTREEIQPYIDECARIDTECKRVLSPYGLKNSVARDGITILGLPGNTGDGDESGYAI